MTATAPTSRFRVHRSTIVVALLLLMFCLILMVPGVSTPVSVSISIPSVPNGQMLVPGFRHGWPLTFLERMDGKPGGVRKDPYSIPWLSWDAWTDWQGEERFDFMPWNLCLDLLALLVMVILPAIAWEWRRRRRRRLLQFKLSELALLCTCIAAVFGWFTYQRNAYREDLAQVQNLENLFDATLFPEEQFQTFPENFTPNWMLRLFGRDRCSDFMLRIVMVNYRIPWSTSNDSLTAAIPHLKQLKKMETLYLCYFVCGKGDRSLALLAEVPQLRTLEFGYTLVEQPFGKAEAVDLVKVQQLTSLAFYFEVTPEAKQILIKQLPNCEIEFMKSTKL